MLNRILGRTKAKDLTSEEIQQIAGAGCRTDYYATWYCPTFEWHGGPDETCYDGYWQFGDPFQVCD